MTFRLEPKKVETAQKLLGCKTRTQALDMALDVVIGNARIADGHRSIFGKCPDWPDESES
ncbi:MAG: hypothetical protein HQL31_07125 [Planctomycetes bacterium]|nr:hypothetical protein [Planctomycetota bacterium]